jgi:hypothetical protein
MHCSEARQRLSGSRRSGIDLPNDSELLEHLRSCPQCAREAGVAEQMREMFESASSDDKLAMPDLSAQRKLVESRMARARPTHPVLRRFRRHPAAGLGTLIAVAVMVIFALVPFRYYRTVGYEVAFAGISPDLVADNDTICDVLYTLGIDQAAVDVLGCDSTCRLVILDLRSEHEAHLVVKVLQRMNESDLSANVQPVREKSARTLLDRANEKLLGGRS